MHEDRRNNVKELQRHIAATLVQAAADPRQREDLLAHPGSVFNPPSQPGLEVPAHVDDMRRQIMTRLMDRAAGDAEFATLLRQDLFQAVRTAGLTAQIEQLRAEMPVKPEVTGFGWVGWGSWGSWILGW